MGVPFTIQDYDDKRLKSLQKSLKLDSKIDVLRTALDLLEKRLDGARKQARWKKAAELVSNQSRAINREFQTLSRLKKS